MFHKYYLYYRNHFGSRVSLTIYFLNSVICHSMEKEIPTHVELPKLDAESPELPKLDTELSKLDTESPELSKLDTEPPKTPESTKRDLEFLFKTPYVTVRSSSREPPGAPKASRFRSESLSPRLPIAQLSSPPVMLNLQREIRYPLDGYYNNLDMPMPVLR